MVKSRWSGGSGKYHLLLTQRVRIKSLVVKVTLTLLKYARRSNGGN